MRTTLTLAPDVAAELERRRRERGTGLKQEVNDLLRAGLAHERREAPMPSDFQPRTLECGAPLLDNVDNVAEVLAYVEDEGFK